MGGDCLNVGCVPSKCLVAAAKLSKAAGKRHHWASSVPETCRSTSTRDEEDARH